MIFFHHLQGVHGHSVLPDRIRIRGDNLPGGNVINIHGTPKSAAEIAVRDNAFQPIPDADNADNFRLLSAHLHNGVLQTRRGFHNAALVPCCHDIPHMENQLFAQRTRWMK